MSVGDSVNNIEEVRNAVDDIFMQCRQENPDEILRTLLSKLPEVWELYRNETVLVFTCNKWHDQTENSVGETHAVLSYVIEASTLVGNFWRNIQPDESFAKLCDNIHKVGHRPWVSIWQGLIERWTELHMEYRLELLLH